MHRSETHASPIETKKVRVRPLGPLACKLDALLTPVMKRISLTKDYQTHNPESAHRTHAWNVQNLTDAEVTSLDAVLMTLPHSDESAPRVHRTGLGMLSNPFNHVKLRAEQPLWKHVATIELMDTSNTEKWYLGWIVALSNGKNLQQVSRVPLAAGELFVETLIPNEEVRYFAVTESGKQLAVRLAAISNVAHSPFKPGSGPQRF